MWVFPLEDALGVTRNVIATRWPVNDGAMFEFFDPVTGVCVGCCGKLYAEEHVVTLNKWLVDLREHDLLG